MVETNFVSTEGVVVTCCKISHKCRLGVKHLGLATRVVALVSNRFAGRVVGFAPGKALGGAEELWNSLRSLALGFRGSPRPCVAVPRRGVRADK